MTWTRVQSNNYGEDSSNLTLNVTLTGVTAGNLLIAAMATAYGNITLSCSDNNGNAWNTAVLDTGGSAGMTTSGIAYATNVNSGDTIITLTRSSANYDFWLFVAEYHPGMTLPLDQTAVAQNAFSNSPSTGNITTTEANELLIGVHGNENAGGTGAFTADGGWTQIGTSQIVRKYYVHEQANVATGTYDYGGSIASQQGWSNCIASFKQAAGNSPTITVQNYYTHLMRGLQ